ncbi:hypothetical protein COTS27_00439 [Spirochaetota bacterium]|nr:hypothetical protein COTS27_00439 [Spirochaetota bacterium]
MLLLIFDSVFIRHCGVIRHCGILIKVFVLFILLLTGFTLSGANADNPNDYGTFTCQFDSVVDGDTIKCLKIEGLHPIIGSNINVRLIGVEAPELRKASLEEKKLGYFVKKKLQNFIDRELSRTKHRKIELRNLGRSPIFFRLQANVYVAGKSIKAYLLDNKWACPYVKERHGQLKNCIQGRKLRCPPRKEFCSRSQWTKSQ